MAVSAFKTTSNKGNLSNSSTSSSNWHNKTSSRRSKSVCASTRIYTDIPSDFVHTWINPLFCSSDSAQGSEIKHEKGFQIAKNDPISSEVGSTVSDGNFNATRGRSIARNVQGTSTVSTARKEVSRSLSRVSTRRQSGSISRCPESRLQCRIYECSGGNGSGSNRSQESKGKSKVVTGEDLHNISNAIDLCSAQDFSFSDGSTTPSLEDMVSFSYLSDTEEKMITEGFEQAKLICDDFSNREDDGCGFHEVTSLEAIKRSSSTRAISGLTLTHTKPKLTNPEAIEFVLDIRKKYSEKYEESQERVRKLKADLALEEQRVQRLGRIIMETTDQKTASTQRSRSRRKRSMERKRLSEEAMAYFDESVSLSLNFDTSDLSASDDPSSLNNTPSSIPTAIAITSPSPPRLRDTGLVQGRGRRESGGFAGEYIHEDVKKLEGRGTKLMGEQYDRILQLLDSPSQEELVVDNALLRARLSSGSLILCPL